MNILENTHLEKFIDDVKKVIRHDINAITCNVIGHSYGPSMWVQALHAFNSSSLSSSIYGNKCERCGFFKPDLSSSAVMKQ